MKDTNAKPEKTPRWVFVVLATTASLLFYALLLIVSKWFPAWSGHAFQSDWALILVAAIPLIVVILFLLIENLSKAKIGDVEFEFGQTIQPSLLELPSLSDNVSRMFLAKGRREELARIIHNLGREKSQPVLLVVPLEGFELRIDFRIMREYIYKLSEVAPIKFIVFIESQRRYLGFTTVEQFRSRFPQFGIEMILEDLEDERIRPADLPLILDLNPERIHNYLDRLIYRQWNPNWNSELERIQVRRGDLSRLGASDEKIDNKSSITNAYWLLAKNDWDGVPVVDEENRLIGILTREKIMQAVIGQLLNKATQSEKK